MTLSPYDIDLALRFFVKDPALVTYHPLGNGHINHTFLVDNNGLKFVLQRINQQVFPDPVAVVNNAVLINKFLTAAQTQYSLCSIAPLRSLANNHLEYIDGSYWRAFEFIEGSMSVEVINDPVLAQDAACAFASFSGALSALKPDALTEVISKFHDLDHRLSLLNDAIRVDRVGRLALAANLIKRLESEQEFIALATDTLKTLPLRVTHNDTKINNLLLDRKTNKPLAVIDLDTCMAGYLLHDFGDMVRTCCSNLAEDAKGLESMEFKRDIYDGLYQGYVVGTKGDISDAELASLPLGARLMPYLLTLRFLIDYLDGDNYFKTQYSDHNLVRACNQFRFYELVTEQRL